MARRIGRGAWTSRTATASTPEGELQRHLKELGLENAEAYRAWCRANGFGQGLHKSWQERRAEVTTAQRLKAEAAAEEGLRRHAQELGFTTFEAYRAWCVRNGFGDGLHKTPEQKRKEWTAARRDQAQSAMADSRRPQRRPDLLIRALHAGEPLPELLRTPYLHKIQALFQEIRGTSDARDALLRLLLHAQRYARLFGLDPAIERLGEQPGNTFLDGLSALARRHADWLREPEAWRPDAHNARTQFGALARHLSAHYPVPAFMDAAWFQGDTSQARRQQDWFLHIGVGRNIRTADLPLRLTKMAAHHFLLAPRDLSIEQALRWGQICALGGDPTLMRAVIATRLGSTFEHEEFWESVLHFFVNNPMLDPSTVGPIVDYVHHRKFTPQENEPENAEAGEAAGLRPPIEPDFTMKGRTAPALLRRVEAWHRQLARIERKRIAPWAPSGIGGFRLDTRDEEYGRPIVWIIEELLTEAALIAEGKELHHCVASYASSCARGQTSIWSMQMEDRFNGSRKHVMTIEVHNARRMIVQARGKCNKRPGDRRTSTRLNCAPEILKQWAAQERLILPDYV